MKLMRKRENAKNVGIAAMAVAVMAVFPVYAEPATETEKIEEQLLDQRAMPGQEDILCDKTEPKFYDGIVTDEMIEEWEETNHGDVSIDLYGNPVEWDIHGKGDEDGAGSETGFDRMEAPTYGQEEQDGILEYRKETEEASEKGWLCIKGDMGEDWPGYNITIAFYDRNNKRLETTIYNQNGFEAKEELPAGIYKIYRAYVPGDEDGNRYPLVVSDSRLEITSNGSAELTVWKVAGGKLEREMEERKPVIEPGEKSETESRNPGVLTDLMTAMGIGIGLLGIGIGGLAVYKKLAGHNRYQ